MKRKGFTLVELLVVIAIIALLMGILMPALAKVKALANRMACGTNLAGIGKAMMVYSHDNDDDYPVAHDRTEPMPSWWSKTGNIAGWDLPRNDTTRFNSTNEVTVTSCLYLLVKYGDVQTKQFVCKGDMATTVFELWMEPAASTNVDELSDAWDFGYQGMGYPGDHCSYSYHLPTFIMDGSRFVGYPVSGISNPASPLCADRNPYLDVNAKDWIQGVSGEPYSALPYWTNPPAPAKGEYRDDDPKCGNSAAHNREGQNVLYNDTHVKFEKTPNVGINKDNIWCHWPLAFDAYPPLPPAQSRELWSSAGIPANVGDAAPRHREDAYLVNEVNGKGGTVTWPNSP